jgi:hypothetical protein
MPSTINADNGVVSGTSGLKSTADTSGVLALQSNGTTGLTLNTSLALGVGSSNSTGTSGQVLTSAGSGAAPTWAAAASATVQTFTSSGTWTKPTGANFVMVEVLGAGGGGGSGRRGAAGSNRVGGAGGGGGAFVSRTFLASEIGSKVLVTVGAGGSGGAARTSNDTSGANGSTGGSSAFGGYVRAVNGAGGGGGGGGGTSFGGGGATLGGNSPAASIPSGTFPGAFGRSIATNTQWPGAGFSGGNGGYASSSTVNYDGESSTYGGGAGGAGGSIETGNNLYNTSLGGTTTNVKNGIALVNWANGVNGVAKFGGSGGGSYDNVSNTPFHFSVSAFGNSTFVVGNGTDSDGYGFQVSTDNGVTWTQYRTGFAPNCLLWDGSKWVAMDITGGVYTTTNFTSWTAVARCGDTAGGVNMNSMAYNSGTYVAVGSSGYIQTSTDLVTWTAQSSGTSNNLRRVIYDGTKWLIAGGDSYVGAFLTSTDAVTWTSLSANLPSNINVYQVASSGSTYVIGCLDNGSINRTYYSTNGGTSWTLSTGTVFTDYPEGAIYANGKFVLASGRYIQYSTTGASFTTGYTTADSVGQDPGVNCLTTNGTIYLCAYATTGTNLWAAVYSTNATSWTGANAGTNLPSVAGTGGAGGIGGGGGGGGASLNGYNSGAGGAGGNGLVRVYTW